VIYSLVVLLAVVLDQVTKLWILRSFELYESREIIPGLFNLVYVTNPGAAFSFLADVDSPWRHSFFLGIGLLASIGLTLYYYKLRGRAPGLCGRPRPYRRRRPRQPDRSPALRLGRRLP